VSTRRINRPNNKNLNSVGMEASKSLSNVRRAQITDSANQIIESEGLGIATGSIAHSPNFKNQSFQKMSSIVSPMGQPTSSSQTDRMAPEIYSPLFQISNLNLPRDRITMNAWNRIYYDTHPLVRNAINLHASFPISKINITCESKKVQQFFQEMAERIDLYSVVYGAALEFWKLGEVFCYAELDETQGMWDRVTILNPDYVHVKKSIIGSETLASLRPDAGLVRLVQSNLPADVALKKYIPAHIIAAVKKGHNIPLDNFNLSHLKLLSSPYDIRGTSIIVSVYKDIMLYDKLRESKFAQADGMINPLTLVKLGGNDYRPSQSDLESFRHILEEAQYDKDFKLVTHNDVSIERVGYSGGVLDISGDWEKIVANLYTGLMVPKALMDQEGATYASSSVGLEVLRQRYDIFRNMVKKWLERKIFAPICEIQDFFEYRNGKKVLMVPNIDFNHMNLYDMNDYVQSISQFVSNKQVSLQTLHRSLGLSYEEERARLKEEAIDDAVFSKEQQILNGMRLSELVSIDPGSHIPEPPEDVQAEAGAGGLPGTDSGMGDMGGAAGGAGGPPPGLI
jgi:hypothetical protein